MTWKIFYSYSHKDRDLRDRLAVFLAPLKHKQMITEWSDQEIMPGDLWDGEISRKLDEANLILLLVSPDFLASEYCFSVEVERAIARRKRGEALVVPILLKKCLWEDSPFSELQLIPRDAKPVVGWPSIDEGMTTIAEELRKIVSGPPPAQVQAVSEKTQRFDASLELVRAQIRAYSRLYERTRQRMPPSNERTQRMEQIVEKMKGLANASYPLLDELTSSPSPGDRLAATAILQVFSSEPYFEFLVKMVGSEKPFVGYHAVVALHFAVGAVDARAYGSLDAALAEAEEVLKSASVGLDSDRRNLLARARNELRANVQALSVTSATYD